MHIKKILLLSCLTFSVFSYASNHCAPIFKTQYKKLNSKETLDLCKMTAGKAVLIVNTASYCGFTKQFKQLQAIYEKYKTRNFLVIGFPSDDFFQEDSKQDKTAQVCYINYGVKFPMTEPVPVRGNNAISIFKTAALESKSAPGWNFHKYLIDKKGSVVGSWSASTKPDDPDIIQSIEKHTQETKKKSKKKKKKY